jgi:hypothetical protein
MLAVHRTGSFSLEGAVRYTLEEVERGRNFKVRFTNIPGVNGSYPGFLKIRTNYEQMPEIVIRILAPSGGKE